MAGRNATALALLAAGAAQTAQVLARAPDAAAAPEHYGCLAERRLAGGRFTIRAQVELDGRASHYIFIWWGDGRAPRVGYRLMWIGESYGPMTEGALVHLDLRMRRQDMARIEVRRARNGAPAGETLFAGPSIYSSIHTLEFPWSRIDSAARAPGGVAVLLVRSDGRIAAQGRIDAAPFDAAVAALAEARGEIEAMVADYRHRCRPERLERIVVS